MSGGHRRLVVVGDADAAREAVAALDPARVAWIATRADARRHLGSTLDAAVLDQRAGLDPELLGMVQGMPRGGGGLVWIRSTGPRGPMDDRADRQLLPLATPGALSPPPERPFAWTTDQRSALETIGAALAGPPSRTALLADRGRGKSSVLGQLASGARDVVVTSPEEGQAAEILRRADVAWVPLTELLERPSPALVLVDEAAGFPVGALRALLARHPQAHIVLASTVQGYEGSGRGFLLRFLAQAGEVRRVELAEPVRWSAGDPLEAAVGRVLAWDARPAPHTDGPVSLRVATAGELAGDERQLSEVFGLLVHAHYRTTPTDLRTLLTPDPDVVCHVAETPGGVVGVGLVSREGALSPEQCAALAAGAERIRGHALADTLICHAGHPEAGELRIARSVRLAVHPDRRREGLAARIVAHEHEVHADAELFGTLFGATADVIRLRRRLGYALVRVGVARGGRSGEVSVAMALGRTERASVLVERLRAELARDWPVLRELLEGDGALTDPEVLAAIEADLPEPAPFGEEEARTIVRGWLDGPRTFEAAAPSLRWLRTRGLLRIEALDDRSRALVEGRLTRSLPWRSLLDHVDGGGVPAVMRAMKAAVREAL
ncbi:MAG: tRNA(Met) cytidine acetyltransferase [Alphaproteobacteria bacterium]|nr:tRNA(Met) cytidine acetyltransferase [Alphaproteobacteria bacterium]